MKVFIAMLMPMLTLFACIAVGFLAEKCKLLPENASKTLAKAEMWIFCPALNFMTMVRFFTIGTHSINLVLAITNTGYMGSPIVLALFGEVGLSFYKIFTLPYSIVISSFRLAKPLQNKSFDFFVKKFDFCIANGFGLCYNI